MCIACRQAIARAYPSSDSLPCQSFARSIHVILNHRKFHLQILFYQKFLSEIFFCILENTRRRRDKLCQTYRLLLISLKNDEAHHLDGIHGTCVQSLKPCFLTLTNHFLPIFRRYPHKHTATTASSTDFNSFCTRLN